MHLNSLHCNYKQDFQYFLIYIFWQVVAFSCQCFDFTQNVSKYEIVSFWWEFRFCPRSCFFFRKLTFFEQWDHGAVCTLVKQKMAVKSKKSWGGVGGGQRSAWSYKVNTPIAQGSLWTCVWLQGDLGPFCHRVCLCSRERWRHTSCDDSEKDTVQQLHVILH